jgi:chromosome segregation ATPase
MSAATPVASPTDRLTAAIQRLETALEARDKTAAGLRGEVDAAVERAEKAEAELAKLKTDYAALSAIADQVEKRLDKAIERLKAA